MTVKSINKIDKVVASLVERGEGAEDKFSNG